jgi:hypothetical protein
MYLFRRRWLFPQVPAGYWSKKENQREFLKWSHQSIGECIMLFMILIFARRMEKDLNIATPEDWYRVTAQEVIDIGGAVILEKVCPFGNSVISALGSSLKF